MGSDFLVEWVTNLSINSYHNSQMFIFALFLQFFSFFYLAIFLFCVPFWQFRVPNSPPKFDTSFASIWQEHRFKALLIILAIFLWQIRTKLDQFQLSIRAFVKLVTRIFFAVFFFAVKAFILRIWLWIKRLTLRYLGCA